MPSLTVAKGDVVGKAWSLFLVLGALSFPVLAHAEPKAPTGLTATYDPATPNTVTLDWDDTPGAVEYWIFRVGGREGPNLVYGAGNTPIPYDKYAYQYAYGYYSKFSFIGVAGGTFNVGPFWPWRYLGSVTASSFSPVYLAYIYRYDYQAYSEYSFRVANQGSPGAPYIGYFAYADYGSYFVMAVDAQGRAGLPSAEAVARTSLDLSEYLKAPDNVKVTPGPGNAYAVVSWDSVSGADLYRVIGKDSANFNPTDPKFFVSTRPDSAQQTYWRYNSYDMYPTYAEYSKFHHYYGDVATNSYVVYSFYGAYLGYPLYQAYVPYGVYKIVAIKRAGDVWSPTSAESRFVPPGATDVAGSTGITTGLGNSLSISNVSADVNGTACTIPANAVSTNTVLSISVQSSGTAYDTALPESLNKQGSIIDFDIGSATLTATITVTLPVPSGQTPSSMRIWHWLNGAWTEETTGRVNGSNTVSCTVSSLSPFVLGSAAPASGGAAAGGGGGGGGCFLNSARRR